MNSKTEDAVLQRLLTLKLRWGHIPGKEIYWAETEHFDVVVDISDYDRRVVHLTERVSGRDIMIRRPYGNSSIQDLVAKITNEETMAKEAWVGEFLKDPPKATVKPDLPIGMVDEFVENDRRE